MFNHVNVLYVRAENNKCLITLIKGFKLRKLTQNSKMKECKCQKSTIEPVYEQKDESNGGADSPAASS